MDGVNASNGGGGGGEVVITLPQGPTISSPGNISSGRAVPSTGITFYGTHDNDKQYDTHDWIEVLRLRVKAFIEHIIVRVLGLLLIVVDIVLLLVSVSLQPSEDNVEAYVRREAAFDAISLTIVTVFVIEILLRVFAKTPSVFFSRAQWFNVVDLVVILVSFIITVTFIAIDLKQSTDSSSRGGGVEFLKLVVLGRLVRVVVLVRLCTERRNVETGARLAVSQNKRRYREDGFDLDLCYITDRVIAMSFPSEGKMAFYRNPIQEVARFFNTKHPGHYKIYNLCSEKCYDSNYFDGRVKRIHIDDHNVPLLKDLLEFCSDVSEWTSADSRNVIGVHCKGGKGRTGTMISAWLMHGGGGEGPPLDATRSLEVFCAGRTDFAQASKVQGVETPSQVRYVGYYERVRSQHGGLYPPDNPLKLRNIVLHSIRGVGSGDGKDLRMMMYNNKDLVYEANMFTGHNCVVTPDPSSNITDIMLYDCPVVDGDVKIMFYSRLRHMPKYYDNCLMYFWIHTSFIENNTVTLPRNDIDNLHKAKVWHMFQSDFTIELKLSAPSCSGTPTPSTGD